MKRLFFLVTALSLTLSACLPAILQPQATAAPISVEDLQATAAVFSQQTLEFLPTQTLAPSATVTPVIVTPSETQTQAAPTETQNSIMLTLTATLGTGTVIAEGTPGTPALTILGTLPLTTTPSGTLNPAISATPTGVAQPLHSGTMPPNLPFGEVTLVNKSKAEVYISLRCVTKEGYVTIIEYPVKNSVTTKAPAGKYTYVVWVGGNKLVGNFALSTAQELRLNIYKDRVEIK